MPEPKTDTIAIRASARRIIALANDRTSKTQRYDLVAEAAAILRLCGDEEDPSRLTGSIGGEIDDALQA